MALLNNTLVSTAYGTTNLIRYKEEVVVATGGAPLSQTAVGSIRYMNMTKGLRGQVASGTVIPTGASASIADQLHLFYDVASKSGKIQSVTVSAENFPGTYKIVGDTWMRSRDGEDVAYQFVIPRAKLSADTTITLEADGDPSVFDLNLRVLRDDKEGMMKFIKYEL